MAKVLFEAPHVGHELLPEFLVEGLDLLPWLNGVPVFGFLRVDIY